MQICGLASDTRSEMLTCKLTEMKNNTGAITITESYRKKKKKKKKKKRKT